MSDLPYYLGFSHFLGIGPVRFSLLRARFGSLKDAYHARESEIASVIPATVAADFALFRRTFSATAKLQEFQQKGITVLTPDDPRYPHQLKEISDPPICLYAKGDVDAIDFEKNTFFGIVGTRRPTSYGVQVARMFATGLAAAGAVIVSGLALGIDALAHQSALDQQQKNNRLLGLRCRHRLSVGQ